MDWRVNKKSLIIIKLQKEYSLSGKNVRSTCLTHCRYQFINKSETSFVQFKEKWPFIFNA